MTHPDTYRAVLPADFAYQPRKCTLCSSDNLCLQCAADAPLGPPLQWYEAELLNLFNHKVRPYLEDQGC